MALSRHSCYSSDGIYCGSCTGTFTDASCCSSLTEIYTPIGGGMPRTRCSGNKLGNNVEISVLTGADGSKSVDNVQTSMSETMIGVLALTLVIGITWVATGLMK